AVAAGMAELGVAIALVVVINGVFAFAQEYRADRAAQRLQLLLPHRTVVRRDGRWLEVDSRELVPGDLLGLAAGDRLPADVVLSRSSGVSVDTSTLTGESVPVALAEGDIAYTGTFLVEGEARALVTATGADTRLARIAELTGRQTRRPTPLALELNRLVKAVAVVALAVGGVFFSVGIVIGLPARDVFLFAIGVAVALVPEGLLPTVTLSLALGASRMAARGALVRRLEAVETLGSTTFVCSDKTGTLTMNQMAAVEVWTPAGTCRVAGTGYAPNAEIAGTAQARSAAARLALAGIRCSNGRVVPSDGTWVSRGDPTEAALHALGLRLGVDLEADERSRPESARFPFDPNRRRMSVRAGSTVFVKGAPDSVLPLCLGSNAALEKAREMAARGLRVLAVATRSFEPGARESADSLERGLELLGLVGLSDPPRPEVRHAIAACHGAGLRVAMITGDHPGTARAIAEQVGLPAALVVTGDELPEDEAMLGALVDRDGVIACRVSPEQKLRIAKALQARGHVVAMTGDGVNDAPALRQADVGIAMGKSGTDVARAAADLVLLDDRFETIVHAIEQGRSTFANIRRFLTYHLTDNVPELAPFAVWA
ncbi:MAG TPA: cation-transporting P-type ATPase, partial [Polyangiaceae bacterium]